MSEIKPGMRVKYRSGRGFAEGTVANVSAGMVTINTAKAKSINRKLSEVAIVVDVHPEAARSLEAEEAASE